MFRAVGYVTGKARAMGSLVCSIKQTESSQLIMDVSPKRKSLQDAFWQTTAKSLLGRGILWKKTQKQHKSFFKGTANDSGLCFFRYCFICGTKQAFDIWAFRILPLGVVSGMAPHTHTLHPYPSQHPWQRRYRFIGKIWRRLWRKMFTAGPYCLLPMGMTDARVQEESETWDWLGLRAEKTRNTVTPATQIFKFWIVLHSRYS